MRPLYLVRGSMNFGGAGFVAGAPPGGLVSVSSAPSAREVRLCERATGKLIASTFSEPDGTYTFENVNPSLVVDVIGRDWSGTYNDVIVSRISPKPY